MHFKRASVEMELCLKLLDVTGSTGMAISQ